MKNIQIIDGAVNCTYDIYSVSDRVFRLLFPGKGQDIEFSEDAFRRLGRKRAEAVFASMWKARLRKRDVKGIHGTLFFGLPEKHEFYPEKREEGVDSLVFAEGKFVKSRQESAQGRVRRSVR